MGFYADLEVEKEEWGDDFDKADFCPAPRLTKAETLNKIRNVAGKRKKNDAELRRVINDFATENGFQESLCTSKDVEWAKYNFVWNRRKAFKAYVSTI